MRPLVIYVAGVRQHAGKTVASLGLISVLRRLLPPELIGYLKPVGQEMDVLPDGVGVDKDVLVIGQFCHIPDLDPERISPVRIGSGATKQFLRARDPAALTAAYEGEIASALASMAHKRVIIAEGTGHPGVGSVVGLSNSRVSRLLDAQIIYLAGGGIGRTIDEMEVDLSYFSHHGCRVRGVLFNKVIPDKIPQMRELITEEFLSARYPAFADGLRIFGFIPEATLLDKPSMRLVASLFPKAQRTGSLDDAAWRRPCVGVRVVSLMHEYFNPARYLRPGEIVIMGAGADQRLITIVEHALSLPAEQRIGGIVLTCDASAETPPETRLLLATSGIPALSVDADTTEVDLRLMRCFDNTKIQVYDFEKYAQIESLFRQHFDAERFADAFGLRV